MSPKSSIWNLVLIFGLLIFYVDLASSSLRPINDLQNIRQHLTERANLDGYQYDRYLTVEEMERRLQSLSAIYSNKLNLKIVGQSVEGRNIYLVTITDHVKRSENADVNKELNENIPNAVRMQRMQRRMPFNILENNGSVPVPIPNVTLLIPESKIVESHTKIATIQKPVIFIDAGIHAREWVAPAAAFYLIDQLMTTPSLTADLEWRIIPQVNPDGYAFSQASDRFWRKNRAITSNSNCYGVDLNRNFDVHFEETVADPCSDVYGGPRAFSEPESQAVRNEIDAIKNRLQAYVTIHTYGQLLLYPFGYTNTRTPKRAHKMKSMGDGMAKAIHDMYKSDYSVGQASMIGAAAGGSDDWAFIHAKAPYSYTFELQPKVNQLKFRKGGFDLSATKLQQAVDECWLALNYLGNRILEERNQINRDSEIKKEASLPEVETEGVTSQDVTQGPVTNLPKLVWTDMVQKIMEIKKQANLKRNPQVAKDCIVIDSTYVCPHMVFWNSMHAAPA